MYKIESSLSFNFLCALLTFNHLSVVCKEGLINSCKKALYLFIPGTRFLVNIRIVHYLGHQLAKTEEIIGIFVPLKIN
jgi:hypothetical protein